MENITFSINNRVKALIKSKGTTISDVASKLGMAQGNLSRMLNDDDLKVSTLFKIAQILNVPINALFEDIDIQKYELPPNIELAIYEKVSELLSIAKQSDRTVFAV